MAFGVTLAIAMTLFIITGVCAVALSVLLSLHAVHVAEEGATQAQINSAKSECRALESLDSADRSVALPDVNAAHPAELLLSRQSQGIHRVVVASHCEALLQGNYNPEH
jgi:hypothetical protein